MAKISSKIKAEIATTDKSARKVHWLQRVPKERKTFREAFRDSREKTWNKKLERRARRITLHKSFKRSYHEEYDRPLELPGLLSHAVTCFKLIFKNWKIFVPMIFWIALFNVILVGLMNEDTYKSFQDALDEQSLELAGAKIGNVAKASLLLISTVTTGGLTNGMSEVQQIFAIILFAITWLTAIYLVRHLVAKHHVKLRDGFYNAMAPLISTLLIIVVVFLELIPIFTVIITYSAAVATEFLNTPFYALVYFIFATLMVLLSVYLLSSSLIGLVAVTAPGVYPMVALRTASNLVYGRRIKLIIRLIFLLLTLAVVWIIVGLPLILLDMWLKSCFDWLTGFPFISIVLLTMTVFTVIYVATYLYLFYRRMLNYDE
ncbi:hypothetical protein IJJ46_01490 [Candidatus Saccharibacteria bacterium]|nr:hypothetical protein [Candidatus Saccharibacteria bacterium]